MGLDHHVGSAHDQGIRYADVAVDNIKLDSLRSTQAWQARASVRNRRTPKAIPCCGAVEA